MIRFADCDFCKNKKRVEKCHPFCDAFPDGIPYKHMNKDLKNMKECNNGIGFEEREKETRN